MHFTNEKKRQPKTHVPNTETRDTAAPAKTRRPPD